MRKLSKIYFSILCCVLCGSIFWIVAERISNNSKQINIPNTVSPSSFEKLANSAVSTDMEKYVIDNNTDPDRDTDANADADVCDNWDEDEDIDDADNVEDDDDDADVGDTDDVDKDCWPCVTVFLSLRLP